MARRHAGSPPLCADSLGRPLFSVGAGLGARAANSRRAAEMDSVAHGGGLFGWTVWQARLIRVDWLARTTIGHATFVIGVLTALASGAAASRLAGTVIAPGGDEPHYLVIAQSLWRDGDLKIENNHDRGDYRGTSLASSSPTISPAVSTAKSTRFTRSACRSSWRQSTDSAATGASSSALIAVRRVRGRADVALGRRENQRGGRGDIWLGGDRVDRAVSLQHLYRLSGNRRRTGRRGRVHAGDDSASQRSLWALALVGLCLRALPWLSTKYAPCPRRSSPSRSHGLFAPRTLGTFAPSAPPAPSAPAPSAPRHPRHLRGAAPSGLGARVGPRRAVFWPRSSAWFSFFYAYWGTPLPAAPYGDLVQTRVSNLVFGAPGLFFDQEYGVLPVRAGLHSRGHRSRCDVAGGCESRRLAVEATVAFLALTATVGAFRIWWGGTASPGRPLASGLLLLALPISVAAAAAPLGSAQRAAHHVLLWISVGIAATLMLARARSADQQRARWTSSLLECTGRRRGTMVAGADIHFSRSADGMAPLLDVAAGCRVAAFIISRWRTRTAGGAALAAATTLFAALLVLTFVMPLLPHDPPLPILEPRVALASRPSRQVRHGVAADRYLVTIHFISSRPRRCCRAPRFMSNPARASIPNPFAFSTTADSHCRRDAIRPMSYWTAGLSRSAPMSLQIGRDEPPWQTWQVQPQPGAHWSVDFDLPVDASFVGFRGGTDLERAMGRLTIKPVSVVDESARPMSPTCSRSGSTGASRRCSTTEIRLPRRQGCGCSEAARRG